jgi:predicted nucleotidyltransferase
VEPSEALAKHRDDIHRLAKRHGAINPCVFGSTARGEDVDGSDLDILIDTLAGTTLFALGALFEALKSELGVGVDLVTIRKLPTEIRFRVLAEAQPI